MDVTCQLERDLHPRRGGAVVLAVQCSHGSGRGPARRPDLSIAAALDRSASMTGPKLDDLKVATRALVESLGPKDRLVLVAFDAHVEVLAAGPVVDKRESSMRSMRSSAGAGRTSPSRCRSPAASSGRTRRGA